MRRKCIAFLLALPVSLSTVAAADGVGLAVVLDSGSGDTVLEWTGGQPVFSVYRSAAPGSVVVPANLLATTPTRGWLDSSPAGELLFYKVTSPCTVSPPEVCDGADNDCDGDIDEAGAEDSCSLSNATALCAGGACVVDQCNAGFGDCDLDLSTGCEADLSVFPCHQMSPGCLTGDSGASPPTPFDVGDGTDYGDRVLELTVPRQCECDGTDCAPCPIVVGFHGHGQEGSSWKWRLEPKGRAVGFISLYPTGDRTPNTYDPSGASPNWAGPSCLDPEDGCQGNSSGTACDWCGESNEDGAVSTQREIDFTRAILKWTMDNYCVDPGQLFATGYSNGGLWVHELAMNPAASNLFKALVAVDGVTQAGKDDHLKWVAAPVDGHAPWLLHVNEIFDNFEPYDGRPYSDIDAAWNPVWIYPPVLQIFAQFQDNVAYSACDFGETDIGDRHGAMAVGGVVPTGYRRLSGPNSLEGGGQNKFHCFTKDASGASCERLAICLWDSGPAGDDLNDPHSRAGTEWTGTGGGTKPMDIMWRFMQRSVGVPY